MRVYEGPAHVLLSIAVGTGVGLLVKYVLDKKYIFRFRPRDAVHDGQTFALYTVTGLFTTFVFWGFEFSFDFMFDDRHMRYLGGVLGLAIGYVMKYHLDRRYVFGKDAS